MSRFRWIPLAIVAAASFVLAAALVSSSVAGPGADTSRGTAACRTDSAGYCTVNHSFGQVPASAVLTPRFYPSTRPFFMGMATSGNTVTLLRVRAMFASGNPVSSLDIEFSYSLAAGAPTTTTAPPVTTTTVPPATTTVPPVGGFPTAATTGVPAGTVLTLHDGDFRATVAGQVIDGLHVAGSVWVCAERVQIRNSRIDGVVGNYTCGSMWPSFTIADSTVGPEAGCLSGQTAVGAAGFTATRVHTRNVSDGFGVSANGPNAAVTIQDSFVELCGNDTDHSDGVQLYLSADTPVHVVHNTINQLPCSKAQRFPASWRCVTDAAQTAPIFVSDGSKTINVRDNLLIGGSSTIRVGTSANPVTSAIVTGNRVVDDAWIYGPVDSTPCPAIQWADNKLVAIDSGYAITATTRDLACAP